MPVVLLLAALAILAGVVVVAVGRGGELAMFRPDSLADAEVFTDAADVAAFRPPLAFFGYNAPATDEALHRITRVVAERDAEVAFLRDQIAQLRGTGAAGAWADSGRPGSAPQGYGRHDSGLHDSGRQGQSEPAGWPDDWTYGGPRGQAEAHGQPGPQADAGWVGGAEAARWAGPEAYAEPERRADPADWPPPAADAGPERVADPADWPPPAADAGPERMAEPGHSNEPAAEPAAEPLSAIQPEHEPGDTSREAGQP